MVKNGNFTLLLTSTVGWWDPQCSMAEIFTLLLTFLWSRMAISHCYWHLVVKNGNFTLLLTSSVSKFGRWTFFSQWISPIQEQRCLEYQYTKLGRWTYFGWWDPQCSRAEMPSHCYWHFLVKNGNFTLLLTSSGLSFYYWHGKFHIATDI